MSKPILLAVTVPNEQGTGGNTEIIPFRVVPRMGDLVRVGQQMWTVQRVIFSPQGREWNTTAELVLSPMTPTPTPQPEPEPEPAKPARKSRAKNTN